MKLNLATLENGLNEFGFSIPPKSLTSDEAMPELLWPVRSIVKIYHSKEQTLVIGTFEAIIRTNCSRCLELTECKVTGSFTSDFRPYVGRLPGEGKIELTPEELDIVWYQGHEIDLTEQVRQNILINLPMQPLCKEDCRGLCVQCGVNLNLHSCRCNTNDQENPFRKLSKLRLS